MDHVVLAVLNMNDEHAIVGSRMFHLNARYCLDTVYLEMIMYFVWELGASFLAQRENEYPLLTDNDESLINRILTIDFLILRRKKYVLLFLISRFKQASQFWIIR